MTNKKTWITVPFWGTLDMELPYDHDALVAKFNNDPDGFNDEIRERLWHYLTKSNIRDAEIDDDRFWDAPERFLGLDDDEFNS